MVQNLQLSPTVFLWDYLKSNTAERFPLVREQQYDPPQTVVNNLKRFHDEIELPIIKHWPDFSRTSTYRCPDFKDKNGILLKGLNSLVGGAPNSAHCYGRAGDREIMFKGREVDGHGYKQFIEMLIAQNIPYDKIIVEYGSLEFPAWLHIQINEKVGVARKQILRVGQDTDFAYLLFDVKNWKVAA